MFKVFISFLIFVSSSFAFADKVSFHGVPGVEIVSETERGCILLRETKLQDLLRDNFIILKKTDCKAIESKAYAGMRLTKWEAEIQFIR